MNMKYMVIKFKNEIFFKYIKDSNLYEIYRDRNKIDILLRKIISRLNNNLLNQFFGKWKKNLKNTDVVIFTDNPYRSQMAKYVKKKSNCKVILYYWNVINENNKKILKDKNIDEIWTFDENDSKKYNIKFFPQFYYNCIEKSKLSGNTPNYDCIFLGAVKDRKNEILDVKKILDEENIKTFFKIVYNKNDFIEYSEYLDLITKTRAIIDIVGESQSGLTLRVLEALYYSKKLITNNKNIKKYDFYNKNNIFIIGEDDKNNLKNFINAKFDTMGQEKYIKKYSYENWINTLVK